MSELNPTEASYVRLLRKNTVDVLPKTCPPLTFVRWIRLGTDDTSIYSIFSVKSTMYWSCLVLHVTCYMWSVMCCMWLVTCKSFIIYWETGDQELCSWFLYCPGTLLGIISYHIMIAHAWELPKAKHRGLIGLTFNNSKVKRFDWLCLSKKCVMATN